ncbi:MAG: cytidylate kinase-like family protein [bacterium]|nr:cytidylate kinase-like family protein [bacterium]
MENYVITISRQFGSLGRSISKKMSENLGISFYDRDIVEATAKRMGLPTSMISDQEEQSNSIFYRRQYPLGIGLVSMQQEIFSVQENIIRDLTAKESCIIVGRCGNSILRDHKNSLNVYIYAPYKKRLANCIDTLHMDKKTAYKYIKTVDRARENYRRRFGGQSESLLEEYDLLIDSSKYGVDGTAQILCNIVKENEIRDKI